MLGLGLILYAGDQSHGRKQRHHGGAPVAEERQRNTDDRGDANAHPDVDKALERDGPGHADADEHIVEPAGVGTHTDAMDDDHQQQHDHHEAADHAKIFSDAGEDEVRVLAGEHGGGVPLLHAGEPPGGQRELALGGLPGDAPAVGVDSLIVGGQQALLLVVLQKIVPQQRDHSRHRCPADGEPVELHPQREEHHQEHRQQDGGAAQIRGNHHDHAEHDDKMPRHLHHGKERIIVLIFPQIGHLLGGDDNIEDLHHLGGLNADAGKADPALVAGVVRGAEDNKRDHQQHIDNAQRLPPGAQNVRVQHGEDHKGDHTEENGKDLHDHTLGGVDIHAPRRHALGGQIHGIYADRGADETDNQQKNVGPLHKLHHGFFDFFDGKHRLS